MVKPLMVLDVREEWPPRNLDGILNWLRGNGIEPADTFRVELYPGDTLFARVFQYEVDERNHLVCAADHDADDFAGIADCRPVTRARNMAVASLPPVTA